MNKSIVYIIETDGFHSWEERYIVRSEKPLTEEEARNAIGINSSGYWPEVVAIVPLS